MNYKYSVGDEEFILSEDEHNKILQSNEVGKIVFLRGGTLGINISHIKAVQPTEKLTNPQEDKIEELKKIAPPKEVSSFRGSGRGFVKLTHDDFYKRMGWEHKLDCICRGKEPN